MGSFLMNCFVSKQVIPEDAAVMIIPIVKTQGYHECELVGPKSKTEFKAQDEFNSICYANSFWESKGVVIQGIADDYGQQKIIDNVFNRISIITFFEEVLRRSYNTKEGENQYHELKFSAAELFESEAPTLYKLMMDPKTFKLNQATVKKVPFEEIEAAWEKLQEMIRENRVFIASYQGKPQQLQLALCLKDSYDFLSGKYDRNHTVRSFENKTKDFDKELEQYKKFFSGSDPECKMFFHNIFRFDSGESFDLNYHSWIYEMTSSTKGKPTVETLLKLKNSFKDIFQFVSFQSGLNELNIKLLPMYGGSQDYQNESGLIYSKW